MRKGLIIGSGLILTLALVSPAAALNCRPPPYDKIKIYSTTYVRVDRATCHSGTLILVPGHDPTGKPRTCWCFR